MELKREEILIFFIEKQRYALRIDDIDRIIRAVSVTKLTDAPDYVSGVIDYHGEIVAVVSLRRKMGYPAADLKLSDRFILVKTGHGKLALVVDDIEKIVLPGADDVYDAKEPDAGGMPFIRVIRADDGIILIYDLERLLNEINETELQRIIADTFSSGEAI